MSGASTVPFWLILLAMIGGITVFIGVMIVGAGIAGLFDRVSRLESQMEEVGE